jgi:hypothetical protein
MNCLAIVDSGNYAINFCTILERKGYIFEVVGTPCQIAKGGCGYSIKFPIEYKDLLLSEAQRHGIVIRELYGIIPMQNKNKYEKIY